MSSRKTPESEILATKWHNSAPNNDAGKLKDKGIQSPDLDASYAKAFHPGLKMWKYFSTPERLEKFLADPQSREWKIYLIQNKNHEIE